MAKPKQHGRTAENYIEASRNMMQAQEWVEYSIRLLFSDGENTNIHTHLLECRDMLESAHRMIQAEARDASKRESEKAARATAAGKR